jgi:hypothetical protein
MTVVWERRVRAALLRQRGLPAAARLQAARLVAAIWFRRSTRRLALRLAVAGAVILVVAPAALVVDLLLRAF